MIILKVITSGSVVTQLFRTLHQIIIGDSAQESDLPLIGLRSSLIWVRSTIKLKAEEPLPDW